MAAKLVTARGEVTMPDPPLAHKLFNTTKFAWLWAIVRIYLGYLWITSGWGKVTGQGWVDGGTSLKAFWERQIVIPEQGRPPITYDWYREFIRFMLDNEWYSWFAPFIAYGELLVGIALVVGAFVGIAAFFGALMNWNFMMAGVASTNPVLLILAVFLMLSWKVAGWYGADRFLLPLVGTPWTWRREQTVPARAPQPTPGA